MNVTGLSSRSRGGANLLRARPETSALSPRRAHHRLGLALRLGLRLRRQALLHEQERDVRADPGRLAGRPVGAAAERAQAVARDEEQK